MIVIHTALAAMDAATRHKSFLNEARVRWICAVFVTDLDRQPAADRCSLLP